MVLNNAINLFKNLSIIGGFKSTFKSYDTLYPIIDTNNNVVPTLWTGCSGQGSYTAQGNCKPFSMASKISLMTSYSNSSTDALILVGSGTTPVTLDDYVLESLITTVSKDSASGNIIYTIDNDSKSLTEKTIIEISVKNTGTESIVVSEIGLAQTVYITSASNYTTVLLYREVLDNPVTIAPEEFSTF